MDDNFVLIAKLKEDIEALRKQKRYSAKVRCAFDVEADTVPLAGQSYVRRCKRDALVGMNPLVCSQHMKRLLEAKLYELEGKRSIETTRRPLPLKRQRTTARPMKFTAAQYKAAMRVCNDITSKDAAKTGGAFSLDHAICMAIKNVE